MGRELDAATIVGLLADDDRRLVMAALALGATTLDAVVEATSLDPVRAARATGRLAEAGLVVQRHGLLELDDSAFRTAARAALARPRSSEHADQHAERRKVLDAFVAEGRLLSIPSSMSKRLVILDWLVQDFEPGVRYSEPMVNLIIGKRHADTAALRRYLVDHEMLTRDAGEYWRSGGSTDS